MIMHTVRIYFEHETKIMNLSRWKRLFGVDRQEVSIWNKGDIIHK